MTDKERNKLLAFMEDFKKKVAGNQEMARKFLVDVGIYTADGQLTEPYKNFRMPPRTAVNI